MDTPSSPGVEATPQESHFPSLYLEWTQPYELPSQGTATVNFRVVRRTDDEKNGKFSVELEITDLLAVEADEDAESEAPEDRLDRMVKESEGAKESYDE